MAFQKFLQPRICTLTFTILFFNSLDSADRKEDIKDTKTFPWEKRDFLQKPGTANARGSAAVFLVVVVFRGGEEKL